MKRFVIMVSAIAALMCAPGQASAIVGHSFGAGLHYLRSLGNLDEKGGLDENNFGVIGSYQFGMPILTVEGNVEYVPNFLGTDHGLVEPSAYLITSGLIYFGAGIGIGYIDGNWQSDPFYALRAGVNLSLGGLGIDVYTTYRFQQDDDIEDLTGEDLDSLTFAGVLRFGG